MQMKINGTTMKTRSKYITIMAFTVIGCLSQSMFDVSEAAVLVTNPNDAGNAINTLGVSLSEEVGNTSLADFNNLLSQNTFTIDTTASPAYPSGDVVGDSYVLTGVSKTINMSVSGGGFWSASGGAAFISSGDQSLQRAGGARSAIFTFDTAVQAFGFTANRLLGSDLTVNLYSDSGGSSLIISFALSDNTSTDHSFFGYTSGSQNILRIDLVGTAGTSQYGIDDISFSNDNVNVAVPEPSSLALFAGGLVMLQVLRRRTQTSSAV